MKTLSVSLSDLYQTAKFDIKVRAITDEDIIAGIDECRHEICKQIRRIMGGPVVVYDGFYVVARGHITWFWNGRYNLQINVLPRYMPASNNTHD